MQTYFLAQFEWAGKAKEYEIERQMMKSFKNAVVKANTVTYESAVLLASADQSKKDEKRSLFLIEALFQEL